MSESYENTCNICYEVVGDKNRCSTPCGHLFCFECIMKSSKKYNTCPMCRSVICEEIESVRGDDDDDDDYEDDDSEYTDEYEDVYCGYYDGDNSFHFPIVIRSIHQLCGVLRNIGFFKETCYDETIIQVILDFQEDKYEYSSQNTEQLITYKDLFVDIIKVYKRSILLNQHFQKMIKKENDKKRK